MGTSTPPTFPSTRAEGVRGRIELGLGLKLYDGVMIDLGAAYDGIGAGDFSAVTGKAPSAHR